MTDTITIGELSKRTDVSVRALRYYEQHELLTAVRTAAGHRRFDTGAVETVRRIRLFLGAGLPLAVVAAVMPCFVEEGRRLHACVADYLAEHMDQLNGRLAELDEQRAAVCELQQLLMTSP